MKKARLPVMSAEAAAQVRHDKRMRRVLKKRRRKEKK